MAHTGRDSFLLVVDTAVVSLASSKREGGWGQNSLLQDGTHGVPANEDGRASDHRAMGMLWRQTRASPGMAWTPEPPGKVSPGTVTSLVYSEFVEWH